MPTSNLSISYHFSKTPSSTMDWFSWLSRTSLEPSLIYDYGLTFARNELQLEDANYFNHEFLQSMGISIAKHRLEIIKLVKKEDGTERSKKLSGVIKKCLRKCMSKLVFREDCVRKDMPMPMPMPMPVPVPVPVPAPEPNWYHQGQGKWKGAVVRKQESEDLKEEKPVAVPIYRSRSIALSGPLDGRMHEKIINNRALKLSGPIDGRMNERMMYTNRSPLMSRPMDGRFTATTRSPRVSGPLDAKLIVENRNSRIIRPRAETESPMGCSPYNKPKAEFDFDDDDDDHTLWPTLFQDMKPT